MVRQPYEASQPASARSSQPSTPPERPGEPLREEETAPATDAPSSRSVGQRAADGVKEHSLLVATTAGSTIIGGVALLMQFYEHIGKITSAVGLQMTALFIGALVLMAVYLARQEKRDREERAHQDKRDRDARAEREATRNAYRAMIEDREERHEESAERAHVAHKNDVARIEGKVDVLVERFDEAAKAGAVLRFVRPEASRG